MHIEKGWNGYRPVILPNIRARQERLFKAVNSMALLLLSLDENEENETKETVERSLKILGQSIYAGRSALWKNYPKDTGPYINRVANWNNPKLAEKLGYQVHDAIPRIFLIRTILPNWEIITGEPKPIITLAMDLPEPFRSNAINNGIGSIQIIPLDSNGNHWGFISFSICTNDRFCSFKEGEILRSGGNLIAATIDRAQRKKPY